MGKNDISISIIVPVYNVEKFLPRCIESIINQTRGGQEIILVDDGSTDKSSQICDEYAKINSKIQVIHKENGGVSSARNVGVEKATGDYITFVDADDFLHPQYLEILLEGITDKNEEISACKWTWNINDNSGKEIIDIPVKYECLTEKEAFSSPKIEKGPCCKLIKRLAIGNVKFDESIHFLEDSIHTKTLLLNGLIHNVVYTPLPLYYYYQRENSASHSKPAKERIPALQYCIRQINSYDEAWKNALWIETTVKMLSGIKNIAKKEKDKETILYCKNIGLRMIAIIKGNEEISFFHKILFVSMIRIVPLLQLGLWCYRRLEKIRYCKK